MKHHESVRWPRKLCVAGSPAHHLGNREFLQDPFNNISKDSVKSDTRYLYLRYDDFAFWCLTTLKRVRSNIVLLRKSFDGFSVCTGWSLDRIFRIERQLAHILN